MEFKYKFNHDHLPWAEEQIWEMKEQYGGAKVYDDLGPYEYEQIKEFLPKDPKMVFEFGSGIGRGSIFLNHIYGKQSIRWVLSDRDGKVEVNTGAFKPKEDEYYNDFEATKSFCKLNGMKNFAVFDTEKDDWRQLPKFDLIFSFCSLGMHVEVERYLDRLLEVSQDDVTMIFGTRHAGYNDKSFSDKFKEVIFKPSLGQAPFPVEHWLILRGKK